MSSKFLERSLSDIFESWCYKDRTVPMKIHFSEIDYLATEAKSVKAHGVYERLMPRLLITPVGFAHAPCWALNGLAKMLLRPDHSVRSAVIGSTRHARRAGIHVAANPVTRMVVIVAAE